MQNKIINQGTNAFNKLILFTPLGYKLFLYFAAHTRSHTGVWHHPLFIYTGTMI
jgi:hypothetical protein